MNSTVEDSLAEAVPAMLIPRLAAMEHDRLMQSDYRKRVFDSHEAMMLATGMKPTPMTTDEEMGDINVANHKHFYDADATAIALRGERNGATQPVQSATQPAVQPAAIDQNAIAAAAANAAYQRIKQKLKEKQAATSKPVIVPAATAPTDWKKYLWPAIAALGLSSAGGMAVYNYATSESPPPPAPAVDTDREYKFEISAEQGKGFGQ